MAYNIKGEVTIGKGLGLPILTDAEMTAYTPSNVGYAVWNSTRGAVHVWDGSAWNKLSKFSGHATSTASADFAVIPFPEGLDTVYAYSGAGGHTATIISNPVSPPNETSMVFIENTGTGSLTLSADATLSGGLSGDTSVAAGEIALVVYASNGLSATAYVLNKAAAASANNRVFADELTVSPATPGAPTEAEIAAFASAGGHTDTIIYYTGTNVATDPVTYVFHVDASGNVTEIQNQAGGVSADPDQRLTTGSDSGAFLRAGRYAVPSAGNFSTQWNRNEDGAYRGYTGVGGHTLTVTLPPLFNDPNYVDKTYVPNNGGGVLNVVAGTGVTYNGPASIDPGECLVLFARPQTPSEVWGHVMLSHSLGAETLVRGRVDLAANQTPGLAWEPATGVVLTLPKAGTYRVHYQAAFSVNATNNDGGVRARIYNVTAAAPIAGTVQTGWVGGPAVSVNSATDLVGENIITVTGPTDIRLEFINVGTATGLFYGTSINLATFLAYEQLPTQTVVRAETRAFSTTEQLTNLTWIGGKPIYEQTIDLTGFANGQTIIPAGTIVDLVSIEGIGSTNGTALTAMPFENASAPAFVYAGMSAAGADLVLNSSATSQPAGSHVTVRYTKI